MSNLGKACERHNGFVGYVDSDYGGDLVRRRSLTCYVFTLYECAISWKATLQPTITLFTIEAKYSTLSLAKNPIYHERSKYINVRLNFSVIEDKLFSIKISIKDNSGDMLIKSLSIEKFKHNLDLLGQCLQI
ncbi:hypothetical protein CR513_02471, partial [Mucuna pruriens]